NCREGRVRPASILRSISQEQPTSAANASCVRSRALRCCLTQAPKEGGCSIASLMLYHFFYQLLYPHYSMFPKERFGLGTESRRRAWGLDEPRGQPLRARRAAFLRDQHPSVRG